MEYMKMYKCQILFLFADRLGNALLDGFIFSTSPPARFHSISPRRTSFLPHPSPPGGTEGLHCWYSRPHRWAALLWWKSECVESLVELHCMYCIYGIKIVFCSSPVSALPSCGQAQVLQAAFPDNIMDTRVGKKTKHSCLFANTNGDSFQCVRPPVGCFLQASKL